jgi:hypothetical protein
MKVDSMRGVKGLLVYPYDEFYKVTEAAELAIEKKDVDALVWCARRVNWFHDLGEVVYTDFFSTTQAAQFLDLAFRPDPAGPPPALIADLVAPDNDELPAISADEAGAALNSLRQFLDGQDDRAPEDYAAARKNIESLRRKVDSLGGGTE